MPTLVSRRTFLLTATGTLAAAAVGDALLIEPTAIQVTRHDLPLPGLGPALDGARIACITDVHLHRGIGPAAQATLEALARERPDVVILAGDICNKRDDLPLLVAWTHEARGTLATFATLGNWEHEAGIDRHTAERAYQRAGAELLYNSATRVTRGGGGGGGGGGATVTIVGIDDPVLGEPDLAAALATVRTGDPVLWTLHAPGYVDGIPRDTTPLPAAILAGHTHGGQIRLPFYTPHTPRGSGRFVAGWYRDTIAPLYVTRGIGTIVVRARLFCRPELPIFTLRRSLPSS